MKTMAGLIQGSDSWLAHRRTTRNASDAPAMMGASPYVSRAELVKHHATGIVPEVDAATQARFDKGHEVEPALRALAEKLIGEDLYPVTGVSDDGYLGASFDGVTLDETTIFEAKQSNASKASSIAEGVIPHVDWWQLVQQFAVCETAQRCIYMVGDGTESGTSYLEVVREEFERDIATLRTAWQQFDADVAAFDHVEKVEPAAPVAAVVQGFGALSLRVEGRILASNLDAFKDGAEAFIARLPKPADLQTDQDFADAEAAVKACEEAETRIKAAKDAAQAQMADVDAAFRLADTVAQTIRSARLALDKVVKVEKENRRTQIVQTGVDAVTEHYRTINQSLGEYALQLPSSLRTDMGAAIKGRRTITSLHDAIDAAVATAKIEASQTADRVRACIAVLSEESTGHESLFADRRQLVASKAPDDLRNLVRARIAEHQQREAERLERERERIRKEEADRLEREQREEAARAERERHELARNEPVGNVETGAAPAPTGAGTAASGIAPAAGAGGADGAGELSGNSGRFVQPGQKITLGEIKDWIAPLSIDAAGLASLGFRPASTKGAAKLYAAADFPHICGALARLIAEAPARAAQKKAA